MSLLKSKVSIPNINDTDGIIADKVDLLFEKRKAVREAALSTLNATLSLRYCGDSLASRQETLSDGLAKVLKDQQITPTILALRVASLDSISLPEGHLKLFQFLNDSILKIMADESADENVRVEAINTLAMTCFMSALFDADHEIALSSGTLDLLLEFLFSDRQGIPPDLTRAALQGCILLGSTLPSSETHNMFAEYFSKILQFMDEEHDIALRVAAAKAAVVFVEWEKEYLKSQDEGAAIEDDLDMTSLVDKIQAVLYDKAKFKINTKLDPKKQRSALKSFISYLEGGLMEEETIQVRKQPLVLHSWTQMFRMDSFRSYLTEGFMNHLEENKNLMYIFDYYVDAKEPIVPTMSKQERRMSLSEASKIATKRRCSLRSIREQEVGYATE